MEPSLASYLALSGILFTIGAVGVIYKRNAIGMFMCIELMLNSVNLTFVAFSRYYADTTGQLRRYLDKLYFHDRTANNIRIHGEQVFIFAGEKLITVHPVPRELRHTLAKVRARRRT